MHLCAFGDSLAQLLHLATLGGSNLETRVHQPSLGVQELQEEAEIRHRDKRKALVKLQKVRRPVRQVQTETRGRQAWGVAGGGAQILLQLRGVSM